MPSACAPSARRSARRHPPPASRRCSPATRSSASALHLRTFVSEDHAKLLLALAGALLWRRSRPLALLAAYPYVKGRVAKRLRNPNPLSPLGAFRIAADVVVEGSLDSVEMAAQARSSVASRELVL